MRHPSAMRIRELRNVTMDDDDEYLNILVNHGYTRDGTYIETKYRHMRDQLLEKKKARRLYNTYANRIYRDMVDHGNTQVNLYRIATFYELMAFLFRGRTAKLDSRIKDLWYGHGPNWSMSYLTDLYKEFDRFFSEFFAI